VGSACQEQFAVLDRWQRQAIVSYLEFRAASDGLDRIAIMQALKNHWYVTCLVLSLNA
jgi:hypothetical protein